MILTDEEKKAIYLETYSGTFKDFADAVEAKVLEKLTEQEPVAHLHQWIEYHPFGDTYVGEEQSTITADSNPFDESDTVTPLYARIKGDKFE